MNWQGERMTRRVAQAFAVSVALHLLILGGAEVGSRLHWWDSGPLAWLARKLDLSPTLYSKTARLAELARLQAERERQIPVIFVDVDPSQASAEPPRETPYYGAVSSRAANPDPSRDTPTPEIKGEQTKVLKTADTERASAAAALQPNPPSPSPRPLQPTPEPPPPQPTPPDPAPPEPEPPAPEPEVGDLAMVDRQPALNPRVSPDLPHPSRPKPSRPRTLAEAMARRGINPDSALVGRRLKQEGGVRRMSIQSSLDVQGSPLGDYDRQFVAAVQKCWFTLLEQQRYSLDRVGRVVLKFRLTKDGRVNNLQVIESDVGDVYTTLCQVALTKPSPYEPWPEDVARLVGADYRDVRFTFYY